jgi:ferrochelatase
MTKNQPKRGVLIVNLGSPDSTKISDVRRYLKQFLWDRRVVNLPRIVWWFILHGFVLRFRPRKSARAYQKIWQKKGSPLVLLTQALAEKTAQRLADKNSMVDYAMRYGKPSIQHKLTQLKHCDELIIIPLYPQYSSTTTASVYDEIIRVLATWWQLPSLRFISHYYQQPLYINAVVKSIQQAWKQQQGQVLLISFHGLPQKLTEWGDPYFNQCQTSAQLIAKGLDLKESQWQLVFQSRFGKAAWLQPYCIDVLTKLPQQGIKNIDIICPGFATDCLETLEEIAITNKAVFMAAGGAHYHYISALNDTDAQVDLLVNFIE